MGKTRDKIASELNVSTGAVSNTISEWKNGIGSNNSDHIRELAIGMKKANIKPGVPFWAKDIKSNSYNGNRRRTAGIFSK